MGFAQPTAQWAGPGLCLPPTWRAGFPALAPPSVLPVTAFSSRSAPGGRVQGGAGAAGSDEGWLHAAVAGVLSAVGVRHAVDPRHGLPVGAAPGQLQRAETVEPEKRVQRGSVGLLSQRQRSVVWHGYRHWVDVGHADPWRPRGARTRWPLWVMAPGLRRLLKAPVGQRVLAGISRQLLPVGEGGRRGKAQLVPRDKAEVQTSRSEEPVDVNSCVSRQGYICMIRGPLRKDGGCRLLAWIPGPRGP